MFQLFQWLIEVFFLVAFLSIWFNLLDIIGFICFIWTYRHTYELKRGPKVTTTELPWVFPALPSSRNRVDGECRLGRKGKGRGMEQDKARPPPPTAGWTPMPAVWLSRSYLDLRSALTMNFLVLLKQKKKPLSEWSDMENVQGCFFFFFLNSVWSKKANPSPKFFFSFYFSLWKVGQLE